MLDSDQTNIDYYEYNDLRKYTSVKHSVTRYGMLMQQVVETARIFFKTK